jgi:PAS domain S-box-containing protein
MFMVDLDSNNAIIREANSRAQLVYGYLAEELRGMPLAHLAPEDTRSVIRSTTTQVGLGVTVTNVSVHRRRDGTLFPVRINATADPTDARCMLMIVEDTTAEQLRRSETQAIDAERRRMSHEIHDSVAQRLAALRMRSALWDRLADSASPAIHNALVELQHELNAAIEDLRRAIFAVRPVDLNELDFFAAVTKWVNGFSLQNKLIIQLNFRGPRDKLHSTYELTLFRIIQEAFSNILRHAGASTARIDLIVSAAGGVVLTVSDNGQGFDPTRIGPAAQAPHFGLPQMRERLLELHGKLTIRSEIGRGTELVIHLPPITREGQDAVYLGPQRRVAARRQKDRA